jgi:hypothetical protein
MWLLDANMDVHLASVLSGLVKAAVDAGYREQFVARWTELPIEPVAGRLIDWP